LEKCRKAEFTVADVVKKPAKRSPAQPFTTSTLQQEASRKLNFSVAQTMAVAQRLYENGKITYMRTDSVNLSDLALNTAKKKIIELHGEKYVKIRKYQTKSKGAQEAHEAIRPTYMDQETVSGTSQEQRLYELIWKRTMASQMADALLEKTTVNHFGFHCS
jgi:DNA topoisomerase I